MRYQKTGSQPGLNATKRFACWMWVPAWLVILAPGPLTAQVAGPTTGLHNAQFTATLLSPMSSETSRKDDRFTAVVQSPAHYRGAILTGVITDCKQPSKGFGGLGARKNAEMAFQFETLTYQKIQYPVAVNLTGVVNKQGIKGVDDEGHVIGTTSLKKPVVATLVGAGAGAVLGGLTHLGVVKGTAIGAGAGLLVGLTMTTQAQSINFSPGTQFNLDVSDAQPASRQNLPNSSRNEASPVRTGSSGAAGQP